MRDTDVATTRDLPVGGQAVLEGVMMRGVGHWAVAVRLAGPDATKGTGAIDVLDGEVESVLHRHRWARMPVLRGVIALGESLRLGFRALNRSANLQLPADEEVPPAQWLLALVLGLGLAVGLFFVLPVLLTSLVKDELGSATLFWIVEGILRTVIFLAYLVAVTQLRDLRRVFQYHGAEHKVISCHEAGRPLEPAEAQRFSRLHPRCGTSFMLVVMIVAIFVFAPIGLPEWYWLLATRVLGIPLIAGLSFELIKLTARHRTAGWARVATWPGMQLQRLTTAEPDLRQLEVAIAALQAVLAREDPGAEVGDLVGVEVVA